MSDMHQGATRLLACLFNAFGIQRPRLGTTAIAGVHVADTTPDSPRICVCKGFLCGHNLIVGLFVLGLVAAPVRAEERSDELNNDSDFLACRVSAGVDNIRQYCSRFIESGRGTDRHRAMALTYRSAAQRNPPEALADLQRAISLDATFAPAYVKRGRLLEDQGAVEQALADYSRAIELERSETHTVTLSADAYYARGILYEKRGEFEHAVSDYSEVLRVYELNPRVFSSVYLDAIFRRGALQEQLGRLNEAIADYRRASVVSAELGLPHRKSEEALKRLGGTARESR
jgi:tetratricopeptide (TPR) repeat protein